MTHVVTGCIKKSEIQMIRNKYKIGDLLNRSTIDGVPVKCPIVEKFRDFCLVQTIGKKEAVLWKDLIMGVAK